MPLSPLTSRIPWNLVSTLYYSPKTSTQRLPKTFQLLRSETLFSIISLNLLSSNRQVLTTLVTIFNSCIQISVILYHFFYVWSTISQYNIDCHFPNIYEILNISQVLFSPSFTLLSSSLRDLIYSESFIITRIMTPSPDISPVLSGVIKMSQLLSLKYAYCFLVS